MREMVRKAEVGLPSWEIRVLKDESESTPQNEDDTHLESSFTGPSCEDKKICNVKIDYLPITDLAEPMSHWINT